MEEGNENTNVTRTLIAKLTFETAMVISGDYIYTYFAGERAIPEVEDFVNKHVSHALWQWREARASGFTLPIIRGLDVTGKAGESQAGEGEEEAGRLVRWEDDVVVESVIVEGTYRDREEDVDKEFKQVHWECTLLTPQNEIKERWGNTSRGCKQIVGGADDIHLRGRTVCALDDQALDNIKIGKVLADVVEHRMKRVMARARFNLYRREDCPPLPLDYRKDSVIG